jgi:hypothetical protein
MRKQVEIEDIEAMRRRAGIDDVELWEAIQELGVGDCVRLTLRAGSQSSGGETLLVRITRVRGSEFRGQLAEKPTSGHLAGLDIGSRLDFTTAHIHSVVKGG